MSTDKSQPAPPSPDGADSPQHPALPAPRSASSAPVPKSIGKYTILARIGSGAMGVVYRCSQPELSRPVAVKVLTASRHTLADVLPRFQREARAASRLNHPSVVQVYDVGTEGELHYIVMEFVDGWSLDKVIGSPALTVDYTLRLLIHIARGLQTAHEAGIVHRDIKPSNILIHRSGQPKLADFGLAKSIHDGSTLSRSGDILGTPRYMSPEQVLMAPREIDARTDIYSLGAVMYEMLTSKPPVEGQNVMAMLRCLTDEEVIPIRLRNSAVPEAVAAICHKALAKDRADRYATAGELAEAMQQVLLEHFLGNHAPLGAAGRPGAGEALGNGSLLAALPPPRPGDAHRSTRRWPLLFAGVLLTAVLALGWLTGWPARWIAEYRGLGRTPETSGSGTAIDLLIAQARDHLDTTAGLQANATPRERFQALVDDLGAALKRSPGKIDLYRLRGRAYRLSGECRAAVDDLTVVLRHQPDDQAASLERLLANYQLHVLYLGNFNETVLRPDSEPPLREDLDFLLRSEHPVDHYAAQLIDALVRRDYRTAGQLAEVGMPVNVPRGSIPDLAMLQADALYHATTAALAEEEAAPEDQRVAKRQRREALADQAGSALRRGLSAEPHHVGLLFLLANSYQRRADWESVDGRDRERALRRHRSDFEEAGERLRQVTLRSGCDTPLARTVLWNNFARQDMALEQVKDAISCRPTLRHLYTVKAWLALHDPPDGVLSGEEAGRILRDLQPAFETPPEEFNPYLVRALLEAALGRWLEARSDLLQCQRRLGPGRRPSDLRVHNEWLNRASAPLTEFLDCTQTLLENLPVPPELRIQLGEEVLRSLADAETLKRDGLEETMVRMKTAWTNHRLARLYAEKKDRARTLQHIRGALELRVPNLTPQTFMVDDVFAPWSADEEFVKLYAMFKS